MRISDWSSDVCSSDLDGFIRRPFLYLGAWYGIGAGAIALGLLATAGHALREPLAQLAASYGSRFELTGFTPQVALAVLAGAVVRSEEHTSELQSLMRISYAVFCLKKKKHKLPTPHKYPHIPTQNPQDTPQII